MKNCFVIAVTAVLAFSSLSSKCQTPVDLGLPSGTLWASCNLGGTNAWDYGDYYAWGETTLHYSYPNSTFTWKTGFEDGFTWDTYKYATNRYTGLTKYCSSAAYGKAGYTDALTSLQPVDDAAQAVWGDGWVIPTYKQWRELSQECYWAWTDNYNNKNRKGYIVYKVKNNRDKGKKSGGAAASYSTTNDTHIFLPAAGCRVSTDLQKNGTYGYYWSATLDKESPSFAYEVFFEKNSVKDSDISRRYDGQSIRPVKRP